jgi:positive regulator of sigma E activity
MNLKPLIEKLTTRSLLATSMTAYLGFVICYVLTNPVSENPVVMLVLGMLSTNFAIIVVFYFRKAQSKESITNS